MDFQIVVPELPPSHKQVLEDVPQFRDLVFAEMEFVELRRDRDVEARLGHGVFFRAASAAVALRRSIAVSTAVAFSASAAARGAASRRAITAWRA